MRRPSSPPLFEVSYGPARFWLRTAIPFPIPPSAHITRYYITYLRIRVSGFLHTATTIRTLRHIYSPCRLHSFSTVCSASKRSSHDSYVSHRYIFKYALSAGINPQDNVNDNQFDWYHSKLQLREDLRLGRMTRDATANDPHISITAGMYSVKVASSCDSSGRYNSDRTAQLEFKPTAFATSTFQRPNAQMNSHILLPCNRRLLNRHLSSIPNSIARFPYSARHDH
ncbi:uncharacterized protein LAESUDRAFT_246516 [Laetiporus sulphureus 93-53]|uniref:Uncharacterized protein n=1 Tax=Laetiporus sulphureus 93-53 TaxID=1314785 RepID=A0A165DHU1_9APHY|nr:uncharacterized protein LAESUDRAFT_246516 [Laetiporus sulphureus 93-53]KZT04912.1 hypothetical protein LAESUDRAFT_246516 [Laetiporus sulphureus 93-53]